MNHHTSTVQSRPLRSSAQLYWMLLSALMIAIIVVASQIVIPLPMVPINLGLLAVFVTGFVLNKRWAMIAVGLYLLMGAFGLPVFANFRGGPQALFGNTGGYLLGYFLSVAIIAQLRDRAVTFVQRALLCGVALLACYIPGTAWLMFLTGRSLVEVLPFAVYPFIPGDILKCVLAAWLSLRLDKLPRPV